MKYALPPMILLALALSACNGPRSDDQAMTAAATSPPTDQPATDVPPATAPPAAMPAPAQTPPAAVDGSQLAQFNGYGDMRFGMSADEAKKAWGGDLNGAPGKGEVCYYLNPKSSPAPSYFAFMIENDKFVRYDVGNDKEVAPGGGKRGMSADQIRALYAGRIEERPHKYVEGGKYLRIKDAAGDGVLVFETDAGGKVTNWHVGVAPQVEYVEGCS